MRGDDSPKCKLGVRKKHDKRIKLINSITNIRRERTVLRRYGKARYPFLSFCYPHTCHSKNDTITIGSILHSLNKKTLKSNQ